MAEIKLNEHDLDKYNFVVKPGTPDYDEQVVDFTLEQHIQQSKAFRAWEWDRYGTTGELDAAYFERQDDEIAQMEEELASAEFNEAADKLPDDQMISTARNWLVNLTANNNEVARKMGMTDEKIDKFRQSIAKMEKAVEEERKTIWAKEKGRVNDAAEKLLKKLGPSSKPFVFHPTKPPSDSNRN